MDIAASRKTLSMWVNVLFIVLRKVRSLTSTKETLKPAIFKKYYENFSLTTYEIFFRERENLLSFFHLKCLYVLVWSAPEIENERRKKLIPDFTKVQNNDCLQFLLNSMTSHIFNFRIIVTWKLKLLSSSHKTQNFADKSWRTGTLSLSNVIFKKVRIPTVKYIVTLTYTSWWSSSFTSS